MEMYYVHLIGISNISLPAVIPALLSLKLHGCVDLIKTNVLHFYEFYQIL
jgi:hypothetical protein